MTQNPPAPASTADTPASRAIQPESDGDIVVARWLALKASGRCRLAATTLAQRRTEAELLF
ncbi:hypothetical protein [Paraburkholderia bannensis]|uniref:hypothetical protein n=1 Tax=Paraburkholderia bannensis TaxID=765414 RepID=UPI002AB728EE|nr:hypothetical protein [Paraburkholderia bannensis]